VKRATQAVTSIPCDAEAVNLAQAFAMALSPHERGLFHLARMGGAEIKQAQAASDLDTGGTYYRPLARCPGVPGSRKGVADTQTLNHAYGLAGSNAATLVKASPVSG
jgi:hypothetical protein